MGTKDVLVALLAGSGPTGEGKPEEIRIVTDREALNSLDVPDDVPAVVTIGEMGSVPKYVLPLSVFEDVVRAYEGLRSNGK